MGLCWLAVKFIDIRSKKIIFSCGRMFQYVLSDHTRTTSKEYSHNTSEEIKKIIVT